MTEREELTDTECDALIDRYYPWEHGVGFSQETVRAIVRGITSAAPAQPVAVPREPTEAMFDAGYEAQRRIDDDDSAEDWIAAIWRAMWDASQERAQEPLARTDAEIADARLARPMFDPAAPPADDLVTRLRRKHDMDCELHGDPCDHTLACTCSWLERREAADEITALRAQVERLTRERDQLLQQAQSHAMEARTANATIAEIYQACSGATGEPGNWNGAQPVRATVERLQAELAAAREDAERISWLESEPERERSGYFASLYRMTGWPITRARIDDARERYNTAMKQDAIDAARSATKEKE